MFKCELCGCQTKVIDSRLLSSNQKQRRRLCVDCGHRFNTIEMTMGDRREIKGDALNEFAGKFNDVYQDMKKGL